MILPNHVLEKMSAEDRKALGKAGLTVAECAAKAEAKSEKELHDQFEAWLRQRRLPYLHVPWGKKSTIAEGHPDFTVVGAYRVACIEFKGPCGRLSEAQQKRIAHLESALVPVTTCRTLIDAITFVKLTLDL